MSRVTLRLCSADDEHALQGLAELDSAAPLTGTVLAAEQEGELRAAMGLVSGLTIADPFHPTAQLVELLHTRAAQLSGRDTTPGADLRRRLRVIASALVRGGRCAPRSLRSVRSGAHRA